MPYDVEFDSDVAGHLRALTARQQAMIRDAVNTQLMHQPTVQTRNRKRMRPNLIATWELRVGDLRVFYDVEEVRTPTVRIRAVGVKVGNQVRIGGKVYSQ